MPRYSTLRSKKAGLPPGSLLHTGRKRHGEPRITVIDYTISVMDYQGPQLVEQEVKRAEDCFQYKTTGSATWINVEGVHDVTMMETFGKGFDIHPLVMEDILNTDQRPKVEDYEGYVYLVLWMLRYDAPHDQVTSEQVSIILGEHFLISFQEGIAGDVFDPIRERLRHDRGVVRKMDVDYLAYLLLDAVIDQYFVVLEQLAEQLEYLENEVMKNPVPATVQKINSFKKEMILLRKSIWPLREVIHSLELGESKLFKKNTLVYLRDAYDHTVQVIETVETYRDILSGMLDVYLSSTSHRLNEVMKVLTIISTIFIPLTFLAGVYGMNFRHMPELEWQYGYAAVLLVMAIVGVAMIMFFRKKRWF